MAEFSYEIHKRIKGTNGANLRRNIQVIAQLAPGRKLGFHSSTGLFESQTNLGRTVTNIFRSSADKQTATNYNQLIFPLISFFYEMARVEIKSATDRRYEHRIPDQNGQRAFNVCREKISSLRASYQADGKGDHVSKLNEVLEAANKFNGIVQSQASFNIKYSRLNHEFLKLCEIAAPQILIHLINKALINKSVMQTLQYAKTAREGEGEAEYNNFTGIRLPEFHGIRDEKPTPNPEFYLMVSMIADTLQDNGALKPHNYSKSNKITKNIDLHPITTRYNIENKQSLKPKISNPQDYIWDFEKHRTFLIALGMVRSAVNKNPLTKSEYFIPDVMLTLAEYNIDAMKPYKNFDEKDPDSDIKPIIFTITRTYIHVDYPWLEYWRT